MVKKRIFKISSIILILSFILIGCNSTEDESYSQLYLFVIANAQTGKAKAIARKMDTSEDCNDFTITLTTKNGVKTLVNQGDGTYIFSGLSIVETDSVKLNITGESLGYKLDESHNLAVPSPASNITPTSSTAWSKSATSQTLDCTAGNGNAICYTVSSDQASTEYMSFPNHVGFEYTFSGTNVWFSNYSGISTINVNAWSANGVPFQSAYQNIEDRYFSGFIVTQATETKITRTAS